MKYVMEITVLFDTEKEMPLVEMTGNMDVIEESLSKLIPPDDFNDKNCVVHFMLRKSEE